MQFPDLNQLDPNSFLQKTLGSQKISALTTFVFSTENKDGGILNIPLIQNNVKATKMSSIFRIETPADHLAAGYHNHAQKNCLNDPGDPISILDII